MRRPLFNLAAAVSLGMMLAMVTLWVRSYFVQDQWTGLTAQSDGRGVCSILDSQLGGFHLRRNVALNPDDDDSQIAAFRKYPLRVKHTSSAITGTQPRASAVLFAFHHGSGTSSDFKYEPFSKARVAFFAP
jgi:hypothetical protein